MILSSTSTSSWENYAAASTNDLKKLFEIEVAMIADLQNWQYMAKEGKLKESKSVLSEDLELIKAAFNSIHISSGKCKVPNYSPSYDMKINFLMEKF